MFGLGVEHPPLTRKAQVRFPGRVIPKTLKMEPTAFVRDAPQKQWSKGKQASEPQLGKRRWPARLEPIGWKLGRKTPSNLVLEQDSMLRPLRSTTRSRSYR